MATDTRVDVIDVAAGEIARELLRRGISDDERVVLTVETGPDVAPGRRASRIRVVAAGLTDDDVDRLIKQAQHEVAADLA